MWRVQAMMENDDGTWIMQLVCRRCWKVEYARLDDDEVPEHWCHPAWEL